MDAVLAVVEARWHDTEAGFSVTSWLSCWRQSADGTDGGQKSPALMIMLSHLDYYNTRETFSYVCLCPVLADGCVHCAGDGYSRRGTGSRTTPMQQACRQFIRFWEDQTESVASKSVRMPSWKKFITVY